MVKSQLLLGLAATIATLGSSLVFADSAKAELKVCNKSSKTAYIAVGYGLGNDKWFSEGWYEIKPKGCEVVIEGKLEPGSYYLYGSDRGDSWAWEGNTNQNFCVHPTNKFSLTKTGDDCGANGTEMRQFFEINVDSSSFTQNLL